MPRPIITLTTDFGTADGYVGEMKGSLLTAVPDANVVDITHDIPPQDVVLARLTIARVWRRFPAGTVHLVVVDPGVGSSRDALAVKSDGRFLVGPDNGVLSPALLMEGARAVSLPVPIDASATFHGRDLFAPAAAALANGIPVETLGGEMTAPIIQRTPIAVRLPNGELAGEVIAIDRFGNAITNLIALQAGVLEVATTVVPLRRTYSDVGPDEVVALVGSSGLIEVAVRNGNAAEVLTLQRGDRVVFRPRVGSQ